ncbi:hypothetical protein FB157_1216 [Streptomyces sp. BK340]|nr:hypothetical protein FB157_1216 [Streptomyces sp. BK340]
MVAPTGVVRASSTAMKGRILEASLLPDRTPMRGGGPTAAGLLERRFTRLAYVSHEKPRDLSPGARLGVRTGEAWPYADVLLLCGVFL